MEPAPYNQKIDPATHQARYTLNPLKPPTQRQRIKTEPSEHSADTSLCQVGNRKGNKFTQEYLNLVNKLKINLSRDCFQHRKSRDFIRQKEPFYRDQNKVSFRQLSLGRKQMDQNRSGPRPLKSSLKNNKKPFLFQEKQVYEEEHKRQKIGRVVELSRIKLVCDKKNNKKDKNFSFHKLANTEEQALKRSQTEQTKKYSKVSAADKKMEHFKEKKKRTPQRIKQQIFETIDEQGLSLNLNHIKYNELCFHIQILLDIYLTLSMLREDSQEEAILLKQLKSYILGSKKTQNGNLIWDDISHLDTIYRQEEKQKDLKSLIFMERILIMLTVDLVASSEIGKYLQDVMHLLQSLLGLYLFFIYSLGRHQNLNDSLLQIQERLTYLNIHLKKQVTSLTIFFYKRLTMIMKSNHSLYMQLKILITEFETRNVTINRAFYELLKLYAIYINNHQAIIDKNPQLKTFATCPSPYLTKNNNKSYTLVLDLDQTLVHVREQYSKVQIFIRPFAKQFISLMAEHFQIVVFTSSMPSYSEHIIDKFPEVSFRLYRYHTTRLKNRVIKDLSRLGRPLSKTIIIDNDQQCFMLQERNGIKVSQWLGNDSSDQQLNIIGLFLSNLIKDATEDVRNYLDGYSAFRKQYY